MDRKTLDSLVDQSRELQYCLEVKACNGASINDAMLEEVERRILALDSRLAPYDSIYREQYFFDLSFALTSLNIGYQRALTEKVAVVREAVSSGAKTRLEALLDEVIERMFLD